MYKLIGLLKRPDGMSLEEFHLTPKRSPSCSPKNTSLWKGRGPGKRRSLDCRAGAFFSLSRYAGEGTHTSVLFTHRSCAALCRANLLILTGLVKGSTGKPRCSYSLGL